MGPHKHPTGVSGLGQPGEADPGVILSTGKTSAGWWTITKILGHLTWSWWMNPAVSKATKPKDSKPYPA